MWDDLISQHKACPMHALVGGGDQLYNDDVLACPALQRFFEEAPETRVGMEFAEDMQEEVGVCGGGEALGGGASGGSGWGGGQGGIDSAEDMQEEVGWARGGVVRAAKGGGVLSKGGGGPGGCEVCLGLQEEVGGGLKRGGGAEGGHGEEAPETKGGEGVC